MSQNASSPLKFPIDEQSTADAAASQSQSQTGGTENVDPNMRSRPNEMTSPLNFPTSPATGQLMPQTSTTGRINSDLQASQLLTPNRRGGRNDLNGAGNANRIMQNNNQPQSENNNAAQQPPTKSLLSEVDPGTVRSYIWATTIDTAESTRLFRDFLLKFSLADRVRYDSATVGNNQLRALTPADHTPFYPRVLAQRAHDSMWILNLDCLNLKAYAPAARLYEQLVRYPQDILLLVMDAVVTQLYKEITNDDSMEDNMFKVRPYNLQASVNLRNLNPGDIDKLVSVKGFIVRVSDIIPELRSAFFRCTDCDYAKIVDVADGKVTEPEQCSRPECGRGTFEMIHARCVFYNKQIIRIQETPDAVPDGQTPHTVSLVVYDELVDSCKPGDRIEATGIYKAMGIRVNPRMRMTRSIFKTFIDVLHVSSTEKKRIGQTVMNELDGAETRIESQLAEQEELSTEVEKEVLELSRRPDIYHKLATSLAPNIFENEDTKKAVLLQLFGGSRKSFAKSESTKFRGNIHVLLCGDPATSKSQILQYVHRLSPRGIYTSGKGSSAVGLTAYVTRDPESKHGALVLSDGGICCIDEFDKMSDTTRSVLHEVMEQQTVSVAKSGIIASLNARTSILAAANPIHSKWNPKLPMVANVNLPPTLLSRFDLICIMLDQPDEVRDTQLARHLMTLYLTDDSAQRNLERDVVKIETFAAYISYAKENVQPRITDECVELMANKYVELRKLGENAKVISATTRQLEAIIRLSEAHARMRLSNLVERQDVEEAVRLIYELMKLAALDPTTGLFDMDLLNTGVSSRQRQDTQLLKRIVREILIRQRGPSQTQITKQELLTQVRAERGAQRVVAEVDFDGVLREVVEDDQRLNLRGGVVYMEPAGAAI